MLQFIRVFKIVSHTIWSHLQIGWHALYVTTLFSFKPYKDGFLNRYLWFSNLRPRVIHHSLSFGSKYPRSVLTDQLPFPCAFCSSIAILGIIARTLLKSGSFRQSADPSVEHFSQIHLHTSWLTLNCSPQTSVQTPSVVFTTVFLDRHLHLYYLNQVLRSPLLMTWNSFITFLRICA